MALFKDNGTRQEYSSGFQREDNSTKLRVDFLHVPFLRRVADRLTKGAIKYGDYNYLRTDVNDLEQVDRFKAAAMRHLMAWIEDEDDEDHAAAAVANIMMLEHARYESK